MDSGTRIAWDFRTLTRVSSPSIGSGGYARMIRLRGGALFCVYESDGTVVATKSADLGTTWSEPVIIAPRKDRLWMSVPDVLELKDGSLLVCYNPRPFSKDPEQRFSIMTQKSHDGGQTWKHEQVVYEAGCDFGDGCWEPAAIQLPDGEIQLYFANEGVFTESSEQNISMARSRDGGMSWTKEPHVVSFRKGHRDGMPSPLLLRNGREIVCAIEDNVTSGFKPYIVRSPLRNSWRATVGGDSAKRECALAEKLADEIYAGAPFLRQLHSGETVLSYQGTEGRPNHLRNAEMKVAVGDANARSFRNKTAPFPVPPGKRAMWNSLCILPDDTIIALTSTNAYSGGWWSESWMIKGRVIPDLVAARATLSVDGNETEQLWRRKFPIFVGHTGHTQLRSAVAYDDKHLYVANHVSDAQVSAGGEFPATGDGVSIQIASPKSAAAGRPERGAFRFFLSADNAIIEQAAANGEWLPASDAGAVLHESRRTNYGYCQELAIPWRILGGKPSRGRSLRMNFILQDSSSGPVPDYAELLSCSDEGCPSSWVPVRLK